MKNALIAVSLGLMVTGLVQAAGDPAVGKDKVALCAGCHGADGNSGINPLWPKLAGQHPSYIAKQISDFKAGKRSDETMSPMAATIVDEDIQHIAAFYASQAASVGEAAADKVQLGQSLYRAGNAKNGVSACIACHGPQGTGNPLANFPRIGGQTGDYVAKALKDFRAGKRANDASGMMRDVASRMSDAEIEAVAQYVQGLH